MQVLSSKVLRAAVYAVLSLPILFGGCGIKTNDTTPRLLKTENAAAADLMKEVNRFAQVNSMRAKMYFKFEDNSFAEFGNKEVYRQADGEVVVQRPAKILLKVQVPIIKSDVADMTSRW